jgi:hypothetical protein
MLSVQYFVCNAEQRENTFTDFLRTRLRDKIICYANITLYIAFGIIRCFA